MPVSDAVLFPEPAALSVTGPNAWEFLNNLRECDLLRTLKQSKILAISKLKLLNYIWRTLSVRNRLWVTRDQGKEAYLELTGLCCRY